jgi:GNAT superfamily N-acetyltransferase
MRSRPVIDLDTISIRAADTGDLPGVLALYAQPDFDDGHVLPIHEAERLFAHFSRYPDYTLYVAEQAGRIVGSFALLIMDNLGHLGAPSAIIEDVVVDPALQGHGVGQAIMNFAVARARDKRCYKILLSSNAKRERAHAFYERLGFERHGYSFRLMLEQVPA